MLALGLAEGKRAKKAFDVRDEDAFCILCIRRGGGMPDMDSTYIAQLHAFSDYDGFSSDMVDRLTISAPPTFVSVMHV